MNELILEILSFQNQMKILHWQTKSYARHLAYGGIYDTIGGLLDTFVEVYQGKYGRLEFGESIQIGNMTNLKIQDVVIDFSTLLIEDVAEKVDATKDSDLLNIRDEMLAEVNKLKFLLSLD